jgi:hypothetical protein
MELDFEQFRQDPFWMYNKLGKESGRANFSEVTANMILFPENEFKGLR